MLQVKRAIAKALYSQYGRLGRYSRKVDMLNRMPMLRGLDQEYSDIPSFSTREAMWDFVIARAAVQIDYLEFGVHEGHSILYWAQHNQSSGSRFFGFDTFTGLPEDWSKAYLRGHFDIGGQVPQTDDARVQFTKGLFQDTLPDFVDRFRPRGQIVVNNDSDLYSSTLFCLTQLDKLLAPGSVLIFDEFGDVLHEFRAFNDYCASYRRQFKVIASHDDFFTVAIELM